MPSQPPNRKITEEQFVDGSTIDGTRIDKALSDTIGKLNSIPKANLKQMMVPRMFYSGWQTGHFDPNYATIDTAFPLGMNFPLYNSFTRDVQGNTGARTAVNNEWRWKGTQMVNSTGVLFAMPAGSTEITNYNGSDVVGRTWSLYLEKPCIITDIAIIWERDVYSGLYEEGAPERGGAPTEREVANTNLKWWGQCYLDSVFNPDDKRKGSVLWRRVEAPPQTDVVNPLFPSDQRGCGMVPRNPNIEINWYVDRSNRIPANDFLPNNYQNAFVSSYYGVSNHPVYESWWDKNLNILVPQQSRLHFGFGCAVNVEDNDEEPITGYPDLDKYKFDTKFHLGYRYNIAIGFLECVEK